MKTLTNFKGNSMAKVQLNSHGVSHTIKIKRLEIPTAGSPFISACKNFLSP